MTELAPWMAPAAEGWERRRIRILGRTGSGSGFPPALQGQIDLDVPFYKVKHLGQANPMGILGTADDTISYETAESLGATVFPEGTLVYAKVGAALMLGRVRVLPVAACMDNNMAGLSPSENVNARFLYWAMSQVKFDYLVNPGAVPSLSDRNLLDFPLLIPAHDEQCTIADYLDRETARIDTLIEEQQCLIEMLRERRFALRTHVALHGTASAEEIESPLPWALMLPAHWRVVPLTSVADLESGHTPSRSREDWWTDCHIPWVSLHDVGTMLGAKYLQDTAQHISDAGIANSSARLLPARTVVLSRDATVGRTAIMGIPMATSQHFAAWVCGPLLDPEYLWVLFQDAMQPFFDSFQNGSTIRTIGMGDLKAFRIPLPPLDEQRRIVAYLDDETAKIDALIAETERFIELSKERRAAVITAAVTGQIDVREMV